MFYQNEVSPEGMIGPKGFVAIRNEGKKVLEKLIAEGAKFYFYRCYHVMYFRGDIYSLNGNAELRAIMQFNLHMPDCDCKPSVAASVREQSRELCLDIPEWVFCRVNNLDEPNRNFLKQPNERLRNWLKAVIESNKLGDQ